MIHKVFSIKENSFEDSPNVQARLVKPSLKFDFSDKEIRI